MVSSKLGKMLQKLSRHTTRWSGLGPVAALQRKRIERIASIDKQNQILLGLRYAELLRSRAPLPALIDTEFSSFSQNGEDGVLLYILSLIGMGGRRCVEICAADGIQCNSANLIINHGFSALLIDGRERKVQEGREFYAECPETDGRPPTFVHSWVTRQNVVALVEEHGFAGEIDVLSLDLDGVDFWIWEALNCVKPRVVVVEYHAGWWPEDAVSVPYADNFQRDGRYRGASLAAFVGLARRKGYRLVGAERRQLNAFFVAKGVGEDCLPEVEVAKCLGRRLFSAEERARRLSQETWVKTE
jgi:hypothetical protein